MPLKRLERGKMTSIFEYNKEEEDKKLYQAGVDYGIEQANKRSAFSLFSLNMPDDKIAEVVGVDIGTIEKWKNEACRRL